MSLTCLTYCFVITDQSNFKINPEDELHQCILNKEIWGHLIRSINENAISAVGQSNSIHLQHDVDSSLLKEENSVLFCCLSNAVHWLIYKEDIEHCLCCDKSKTFKYLLNRECHVQVLITGSLHLVGGVMSLIDS